MKRIFGTLDQRMVDAVRRREASMRQLHLVDEIEIALCRGWESRRDELRRRLDESHGIKDYDFPRGDSPRATPVSVGEGGDLYLYENENNELAGQDYWQFQITNPD